MIEVFGLSENSAGTCLGPDRWRAQGSNWITSYSPTTGESIGRVRQTTMEEYHELMGHALETAKAWSKVPAPQRGEAIRLIGVALREHKTALGQLISLEMGKILAEGEGGSRGHRYRRFCGWAESDALWLFDALGETRTSNV